MVARYAERAPIITGNLVTLHNVAVRPSMNRVLSLDLITYSATACHCRPDDCH